MTEHATWVKCDCCEDFLCNIHGGHAFECPCPAIDEWVEADFDPYLSTITPELRKWVSEHQLEND